MQQLRTAIASFHLPTLAVALGLTIASSVSVNGQPLDLTTPAGRAVAGGAILGILIAAVRTWMASGQAAAPAAPAPAVNLDPADLRAWLNIAMVDSVDAILASLQANAPAFTVPPASPPQTAQDAPIVPSGPIAAPPSAAPVSVAPVDPWLAANDLPQP